MQKKSSRILASVLVVELCLGQNPAAFAQQWFDRAPPDQSAQVVVQPSAPGDKMEALRRQLSRFVSIHPSAENPELIELVSRDDRVLPSVYDYRLNLSGEGVLEVYKKGSRELFTTFLLNVAESEYANQSASQMIATFGAKLRAFATVLVKSQKQGKARRDAANAGADVQREAIVGCIVGVSLYSVAILARKANAALFAFVLIGATYVLSDSLLRATSVGQAERVGRQIAERQKQLDASNLDPVALLKAIDSESQGDLSQADFGDSFSNQISGVLAAGLLTFTIVVLGRQTFQSPLGLYAAMAISWVVPIALVLLWQKAGNPNRVKTSLGVPNLEAVAAEVESEYDRLLRHAINGETEMKNSRAVDRR